ncbi:MAG: radical SAM protein [Patescibacteria group bacterium]|nr:radical SAM protein [Patescibacteria group bacterium]
MKKSEKAEEWSFGRTLNPFNSLKVIAHLERWSHIKRGGAIPPPVLVTVDPTNECNYNCIWCNSKAIINKRSTQRLSGVALGKIAQALNGWKYNGGKYGVRAVCIAGGGEPLLNTETGFFIDNLVDRGIEVGVITNGSHIDNFIESLAKCHWVSVSVDSGTAGIFASLKKVSLSEFDRVIGNMQALVEYSRKNSTYLAQKPLSFGVTYKFLVHEKNVHEIDKAAELAKAIGCRGIHIRPVGKPWYSKADISFNDKTISMFYNKLRMAREMEDENFSVYGVTHKFTPGFSKKNNFAKCHALFMTTVFSPPVPGDHPDSFTLCQCCDRRGDSILELSHDLKRLDDILSVWGSDRHWRMHDKLDLGGCPRCTYSPHNEIYEKVLCEDNMSINFI